MAWPKDLGQVRCTGFPKTILPALKHAIDTKQVVWDTSKTNVFAELGSGQFEFAECVWELEEMTEVVTSIRLIKGNPITESLTHAMLKA